MKVTDIEKIRSFRLGYWDNIGSGKHYPEFHGLTSYEEIEIYTLGFNKGDDLLNQKNDHEVLNFVNKNCKKKTFLEKIISVL